MKKLHFHPAMRFVEPSIQPTPRAPAKPPLTRELEHDERMVRVVRTWPPVAGARAPSPIHWTLAQLRAGWKMPKRRGARGSYGRGEK